MYLSIAGTLSVLIASVLVWCPAVIALDQAMVEYYERVNSHWRAEGNSSLGHITLVSSGGGDLDVMVRGGLTHMNGVNTVPLSVLG